MLFAHAVAFLHAAAVLFMLTGALLAVRWPRLVLLHAPVALAILAVNLAGADCPLTDLELLLRERAGAEPYEGGFLGHYVFGPLGLDIRAAGVQLGIYATAFGLNAIGYAVLFRQAARTPDTAAPRCPAQPVARTASSSRRSDSGIVRAIRRG
ncbi:DUF2784 domain-containing protein [Blastococcus goldschmidtiae]|uniref:DUF2784 domain-containing protein n=1 Tax=Blastococcus goldschmidtiae TaxID=3075546 RepID=A0ABU2K7U7_9ACTN|nr:DUF2784 domain-containing protein [Blastococcus sp. DSM 46792]MDT0276241.1 DUF2784 domain-containing protein [Blastococcus sp. DSM 46792]